MDEFDSNSVKIITKEISAILKGYYPQQLSNPEFLNIFYNNFKNKQLGNLSMHVIKSIVPKK